MGGTSYVLIDGKLCCNLEQSMLDATRLTTTAGAILGDCSHHHRNESYAGIVARREQTSLSW